MRRYVMDKNTSNAKIKTSAKADMVKDIMAMLAEAFGEENVAMVRTGNTESSKTNEIAVKIGEVEKGVEICDLVMTLNPTIKEFEDRKTTKKVYTAFSFEEAKLEYEEYIAEKEEKEAEKKEKKEKKKEKDKAKREKKVKEEEAETVEETAEETVEEATEIDDEDIDESVGF